MSLPQTYVQLTPNPQRNQKNGHQYYGADGSAIANLGSQKVFGTDNHGSRISLDFDVAKISRPLASVAEMVKKNYRVIFDEGRSYIENKATGRWTPLRQEGNLFFLDIWVRVPEKLASSPFVRQVA